MSETNYIYKLTDPRNGDDRYIGRTNNLDARYQGHSTRAFFGWMFKEKSAWVQELWEEGHKPLMTPVETVSGVEIAKKREMYWIGAYLLLGAPLLNQEAKHVSNVNVTALRLQKGLSTQKLSEITGINHHVIKKIERNASYKPTIEDLIIIATSLEVDVEQLFTEKTVLAPQFAAGESVTWISDQADNPYQRAAKVISVVSPRNIRIQTDETIGTRYYFNVDPNYLIKN